MAARTRFDFGEKYGIDDNKKYNRADLEKKGVYDQLNDIQKSNLRASGSGIQGGALFQNLATVSQPDPPAGPPPPAQTPPPAAAPPVAPTPLPPAAPPPPAMESLGGGGTAPPPTNIPPAMASLMGNEPQPPDAGMDVAMSGPPGLRANLGLRNPPQYNYALASLRRGVY